MKLILSLLIIIFVVVTGCSEVDTNSIDDSPEATFRIIEIGVKDCNFENIVNLLSPSVYEKPFGKEYIDLSNNCNNLVSNMDCINSCSSNENFFQKYGYSCEQVCNADCTSRKIVLEIGCIFNTRNYQKHITSFEIIQHRKPLFFKIGTSFSISCVFPEPTGPPIPSFGIFDFDEFMI